MAIQVTKRGTPPQTIPLQLKCSRCGCELTCLPSDLHVQNDRNEVVRYLPCPTCQKWIYAP